MFGSCMHSHMQRWPIIDCRCTSQNYKEPFRFMLGTQVLIGRHIWSRSLAWLYYGPNFVGFFSDFCQSGTNVSLLSRSLIVQFLSLLSAWLSSRSVSLLSETIFLASILPMSRSEFLYGSFQWPVRNSIWRKSRMTKSRLHIANCIRAVTLNRRLYSSNRAVKSWIILHGSRKTFKSRVMKYNFVNSCFTEIKSANNTFKNTPVGPSF